MFSLVMEKLNFEEVLVGLCGLLVSFLFAFILLQRINLSCRCSTTTQQEEAKTETKPQTPQTVRYYFPLFKSTFSFLFDGLNFCSFASQSTHGQGAVRIALFHHHDVYLVKGAKNVAEIFRKPALSVTLAYGIALRYCFGMASQAAAVYNSDTSGSHEKAIAKSNVLPHNRVSYRTHENLVQGLFLGVSLTPASDRFENTLTESFYSLPISDEWVEFPDLVQFFENHIGTAIVETFFGSALLAQNPGFIRDLWAYDKGVMSLAKRLPSFWIPDAYRLREKLRLCVKRWHAGLLRDEDEGKEDRGDGFIQTPQAIRDRLRMLLSIDKQDFDAVASTDLGLIWATVTNVVPSAFTLAIHIFRDKSLLSTIRHSLADAIKPGARIKLELKKLEKHPLLLSMYAETLRFGVQILVPRCSPHQNLAIGRMIIPENKLILMSTWLAHTDEEVWNTKEGTFPLDTFWPQRFLIDPKDPLSGPTKTKRVAWTMKPVENRVNEEPRYSTEGLEGAWIPYGGGHHACPGRAFAKRIMLISCVLITTTFDIEILEGENKLEYGSPRFGFGVRKPKGQVPFLIRRRTAI